MSGALGDEMASGALPATQRKSVGVVPIHPGGAEPEDYTPKVARLEHLDSGRYDIANDSVILTECIPGYYSLLPALSCSDLLPGRWATRPRRRST